MLYKGSCHCGRVAFEVEGELTGAVSCNCSICSRKGALLWAVPHGSLRLRAAPQDLAAYEFNRHAIRHRFCRSCGIHPFAEDVEEGAERSVYINIRCLEDIDLASVPVHEFDGRSM
ncbi:GFA family protein [Inquilinus limosus]|uniref:GFA family protein n=1 Tax=Inquilinus limosus TaxID=171674 RepID=UPI003F1892C0